MAQSLPAAHFLSLPRPDAHVGPPAGVPDTSTLAAHDFDVDTRTGFMPPQPPIDRLPSQWEQWEILLQDAVTARLQLGDSIDLKPDDQARSESWRSRVRELPILPTSDLARSEILLRRAHHVLAWILHFYVHTLPPDAEIRIPPPLTTPLLQVSTHLHLPPVLSYSDNVLYNWTLKTPPAPTHTGVPEPDNIRCQTTFTSTPDEAEFFLCTARIELRGVLALELMRSMMDELFVGDAIAVRRITLYLDRLAHAIRELKDLLLSVRAGCDPQVYFHSVRPWLRGQDSDPSGRRWVFEGLLPDSEEGMCPPTELSGPSAGQSSLVHALTIFLGVDVYTPAPADSDAAGGGESGEPRKETFLTRMLAYMPRHHRAFLLHLSTTPLRLRDLVLSADDAGLRDAYNSAVRALKEFRDAHMIVVALYIVGPAKRARRDVSEGYRGTGGTDVVRFLKGVRDTTARAVISEVS